MSAYEVKWKYLINKLIRERIGKWGMPSSWAPWILVAVVFIWRWQWILYGSGSIEPDMRTILLLVLLKEQSCGYGLLSNHGVIKLPFLRWRRRRYFPCPSTFGDCHVWRFFHTFEGSAILREATEFISHIFAKRKKLIAESLFCVYQYEWMNVSCV